ncbi:unnamed protein product [Caenorhabditis auriculariae]|uniref:Orn/DAP/Arg decarboxylase 2 N-terminal domain-containing protein n=1 Tax=Caenorhabditis auriculariae TaxID=2777116 RepID=A0A8S1HX14_9PELO|nr:unnamed protein product [Caenorhabditis auriculariae]
MTVTIQKELLNGSKVTILPKKEQSLTLARRVAAEKKAEGCDEAFYVANLDNIIDRFNLWKKELPMFEPFYAVKCNPDPEIDLVTKMGVRPEKVIYAHPCKSTNFLLHAKKLEISLMTFDNAEELEKIAEHYEKAELIIRIGVADLTANCQLSVKFGCDPELEAPDLLRRAAELGLNVAGVSFHVGSGCNDPTAFRTALKHTKRLFGLGASLGFNMKMIDVGGGFPGSDHHLSFEKIAEVLRNGVEEYFGDSQVRLIAEPGRESLCCLSAATPSLHPFSALPT